MPNDQQLKLALLLLCLACHALAADIINFNQTWIDGGKTPVVTYSISDDNTNSGYALMCSRDMQVWYPTAGFYRGKGPGTVYTNRLIHPFDYYYTTNYCFFKLIEQQ